MKDILIVLGAIIVLIVFGSFIDWVATGNDFFMYKFWAPKYEDVRRDTYTHTQSYRQGSVQRLATLCNQIETAEPNQKVMLNNVIAQEFAEWSSQDVPAYLRSCLSTARH